MDLTVQYEDGLNGKKADVYKNLQKDCYSVRSRESETYGTVISHEEYVVVKSASFEVSETQRQTVIEEERKNVHAVVRGVIADESVWGDEVDAKSVPVTYNPYEYANFVHAKTEEPIDEAALVLLSSTGAYAYDVVFLNS